MMKEKKCPRCRNLLNDQTGGCNFCPLPKKRKTAPKPRTGWTFVTPTGRLGHTVHSKRYDAIYDAAFASVSRHTIHMPEDWTKAKAVGWRIIRVKVTPL